MASDKKKGKSNPLEALREDGKRVKRKGRKIGIMEVKQGNQWIKDSKEMPDPKLYFHDLIVEGENTVVFASSNVGKSIFCTQMAESIARETKVLYIDCELSAKQFQMRYTNSETGSVHLFPENFLRAEIDPELIVGTNLEEAILQSIQQAANDGITHFFVDNITFLCNDSEKGQTAGEFMMKLIKLKRKFHLTLVIIAHTPKRDRRQPITQNDLAGSAKLINFFDAGIAIGVSAKDEGLRYVIQVKVRTGGYVLPSSHVALYRLQHVDNYTQFVFEGYGDEKDHLREKNAATDMEDMQEIVNLKAKGLSVRQIVEETGFKQTTVFRKLKKAEKMGVQPTVSPDDAATDPAFRSASEGNTEEQGGTPARLPFKDND